MVVPSGKNCEIPQRSILWNAYVLIASVCVQTFFLLFMVLSIPIYIFRQVVILLAKWYRPDLGACIGNVSAHFATDLYSDKAPRCSTVLPITLQGTMHKEELREIVNRNWIQALEADNVTPKYPQFRTHSCLWLGFLFWKIDKQFQVSRHVHSYAEYKGHSEKVTETDLNNFVEELLNVPYPPDRSPWDLYVVESYENPKFGDGPLTVLLMRIHHSLGDGFSLVDALVGGLFEIDLNVLNLPKISRPKRSSFQRIIETIKFPFLAFCEISLYFRNMVVDNPWKAPDHVKAWRHRYANSDLIPVENIKHVKSVLCVSFTSVLLSAISAGITKNLQRKRDTGTLRVPLMDDSIVCMTALPLPETEKTKKHRIKNNVTGMIFQIPCVNFPTPVDRLKECDQVLNDCKSSVMPYTVLAYEEIFGAHLAMLGAKVAKNRSVPIGLTNFPTKPSAEAFGAFAGREILFAEFASGELVGDAGVGFMVVSFYPYIRLAITAECSVLSRQEIDDLVKCIEEEFRILYDIAKKS